MASNTASTHPSGPKRAAPSGFFRHAAAASAPTHCSCAARHRRFSASVASASAARASNARTTCASTARPPARVAAALLASERASVAGQRRRRAPSPSAPTRPLPANGRTRSNALRQTASFRHLLTDVVVHRGVFQGVGDGGEERGIFLGGKPSQRVRQRGRRAGGGHRARVPTRSRRWRDRGDRRPLVRRALGVARAQRGGVDAVANDGDDGHLGGGFDERAFARSPRTAWTPRQRPWHADAAGAWSWRKAATRARSADERAGQFRGGRTCRALRRRRGCARGCRARR